MGQRKFTVPRNIASNAEWEDVTIEHLQVGHTHNSIDQCFSSTSSILARAPVLEDPEEFVIVD